MNIQATFVRSAARAEDLPHDALATIAVVGRSNVGKSSLINALVRQRVARTSAAPGKTRLANVYRVQRASAAPLYLVDLPGYGYARGDADEFRGLATDVVRRVDAALLLVDARHPGLANDVSAWRWLTHALADRADEPPAHDQRDRRRWTLVATKIDKLSRAERLRAIRDIEAVFDHPVTAVSAETGEGLDELWTLIDRLPNNSRQPRRNPRPPNRTAAADQRPRRPRPRS